MELQDLMIGDWVFNTHHQKNIQLTPYDFFTHGHEKSGVQYLTSNSKPVTGKDFKAIQITPEILEKNGIVYDYDQEECVADYTYIKVRGYQYSEENVLIDYCNGHITIVNECVGTIDMDINYVHELQHTLRLCKIDKEIEL